MADYDINAVTRRVQYSGSAGTGPYAFSFEVLNQTDIAVYKNATKLTLTTDYTVSIGAAGTGSVTLVVAAAGSDTVTLVGARDIERTTDFVTGGAITASAFNDQLDALTIFDQQLAEADKRTLSAPVYDPNHTDDGGTLDMTLPAKATRAGKLLGFDETTGNPTATFTIDDASTLASISADIATLADIEDGTDATDAIQTVAGISSNVSTVAGISGNVTTVAGISSNVTSVAGNASNINTVAGISSNVTTVAGVSSDVTTVAGVTTDLGTLADIEDGTVATNAISNLGPISSDITTVSGVSSDVTTVAGISGNVTTVAGVSSNVTTVAGIAPNVTTVAGISANVTTVAGISSDVTTVAANVTDVNTFANRYRIGATDPVTSLDEGDLFYNTTDDVMKYYTGTTWEQISSGGGISDIVQDLTPQLGGNLDLNSKNITGTGDLNFTGSITLTGTVDGRDVSTDGTKLDGIESGATADQTGAEIKSLYEAELDTNAFTDAEKTKLAGIETGATADQTGAEIATALNGQTITGLTAATVSSSISVNTINEYTAANGVSIDGVVAKDSIVRASGQPMVSAAKSNANYTGNAVITSWNAIQANIGSHFNTTTGVFTCPFQGSYFISGRVLLNNNNAASYYYLDVRVNGSNALRDYHYVPVNTFQEISVHSVKWLQANDTITLVPSPGNYYGVDGIYTQFNIILVA